MAVFHSLPRSSKARWAAILLALGAPVAVTHAQQDAPKKEISDKVAEQFAKIRELTDAKNYDAALKIIDDLSRGVSPNSYDLAVLSQVKAQVLLTNNNYAAAIPPLETAVRLGETYEFLEPRQLQEYLMLLSQLHFQVAVSSKNPVEQRPGMDKAVEYLRRYLSKDPKLTPESQLYVAQALYQRATIDEQNIDTQMLKEARDQAEKGLLLSIKPRDTFYVLILAALQQDGRDEEAAEFLELLVKQNPTNRQYWQQLAFTYLNLAEKEKNNPDRAYDWNVRTILTIERAQELGIMDTPRDHFNLIGIYFNIQRFDQAVELLEQGLKNGKVESTQRNWELLASSYQQIHKEFKAIEVLNEAAKLFPEAGQIEFTIAQTYYMLDKMEDAYRHAVAGLRKGNLDKRSTVLLFAAYVGYELRKYEDALKFAEEASKDPEAENAERLVKAIRDSIEEREQALKAKAF